MAILDIPAASPRAGAESPAAAIVRVDALRNFSEVVAALGGDPVTLLKNCQIDPESLRNRHAVVPYRAFMLLLERAASSLNCPDFGMRLAAAQGGAKVLGPLEVAMCNSATLREAFCYCAEHVQAYSTATRVTIEEDRAKKSVFLKFDIVLPRSPHHPQTLEHAMLLVQHNVLNLSNNQVRAREIWLTHQAVSPPAVYRANFGATVKFGQTKNGVLISRQDFDQQIQNVDAQLYELATSFIENRYPSHAPPFSARVRMSAEQLLLAGDCSYRSMASALGMHPRSLQRRLRAEGVSFESIRDDVRRDIALRYLQQSTLPLTRVAEVLGYSETSVLSRSCYRWFSASPRQLRDGANRI